MCISSDLRVGMSKYKLVHPLIISVTIFDHPNNIRPLLDTCPHGFFYSIYISYFFKGKFLTLKRAKKKRIVKYLKKSPSPHLVLRTRPLSPRTQPICFGTQLHSRPSSCCIATCYAHHNLLYLSIVGSSLSLSHHCAFVLSNQGLFIKLCNQMILLLNIPFIIIS